MIALGVAFSTTSYAEGKVGFINLQKLISESRMGKEAKEEISKLRKEKEAMVARKLMEVNRLKEVIEKEGDKMDPVEKRHQIDTLDKAYNETMHACALAAACEAVQTPSGVWVYDPILSNVVKNIVTKNMYEICRLAEEIAGGFLTTQPSEKDLRSPKIGPYIKKYLRGVDGVPTEHRMRMFRLLECFTYGQGSTYARFEAMHGAGSPEAQKIFIQREYDFEGVKKLARIACGIEGESH